MERIGPYRIVRTIALGGMGEVFLAALQRAGGFEKRVALKCVLPRLMADPHFVELFEREARLAAALTHRHIVQIFDFGRDQGRSWLAMEFVHGVDLKAVMDRLAAPLPLGLAIEIGVACARGLDYAHRARDPRGRPLDLVHRDVSPQNVLLSFEGDVKLADFGLAHAAARDPHEGGLQGKFAYMSPEQVAGTPLDGRSDQFALGVVLFEMLSGERAFFGDDGVEQILDRVRRSRPHRPLTEAAPTLHPAVVEVVERAMRVNRTERFPDAGALASALLAAAATAGVIPGQPGLGRWLREQFPGRSAATPQLDHAEVTAAASVPPRPAESTAVAQAPIASTPEHTVDASTPIVDPMALTPSAPNASRSISNAAAVAGLPSVDPDDADRVTARLEVSDARERLAIMPRSPSIAAPPSGSISIAEPEAPAPSASDAPAADRRALLALLALMAVAILFGGWWLTRSPDGDPGHSAQRSPDAEVSPIAAARGDASRAPLDGAMTSHLDAGPADAAADAGPTNTAPADAAANNAAAVDRATPARDTGPGSIARARHPDPRPALERPELDRPDRERPDPPFDRPPPRDRTSIRPPPDHSPPDLRPPGRRPPPDHSPPDLRPPPDRPDEAPGRPASQPVTPAAGDQPSAPIAEPAPTGPRVRIVAANGGLVISKTPARDGWRPVDAKGLLVRVVRGGGPPVRVRIRARGGRFVATVAAEPWGKVSLDGRDVGETPAAAVPLEPGHRVLRVTGPDGGQTEIRIEVRS